MLFGRPLRATTSRRGKASPEDRNAANTSDECMTDLTRYGSREGGFDPMGCLGLCFALFSAKRRGAYHDDSVTAKRLGFGAGAARGLGPLPPVTRPGGVLHYARTRGCLRHHR